MNSDKILTAERGGIDGRDRAYILPNINQSAQRPLTNFQRMKSDMRNEK